MNNNINILLVSSANPSVAAGVLAVDYYKALKQAGCNIDFLTKYKNLEYSDFLFIYDKIKKNNLWLKGYSFIKRVFFKIYKTITKRDYHLLSQRYFFYKNERKPPVSNQKLLKSLPEEKQYDLIMILFWQEMLSAVSLEALYDKYKCPVFIFCADYSPMTGGCHFIADCKTFEKGCGDCECWYSKKMNDFTHKNVLEKKRIYQKIRPVVFMNKYMDDNYASKSPVLENQKKEYLAPVINEELFCPIDKRVAKNAIGLDENKKVIFFACQNLNDTRKGGMYVLEALDLFYKSLSENERANITVILAGKAEKEIASRILFESKLFGYVDTNKLIQLYQAADVYLSGSVIDAGPMMVNQALSCGVPVVAFNIGTAIDVVNGKNTGYVAKEISSQSFADGIKWWYNLSEKEYTDISKNCRNIALSTTSYKVFSDIVTKVYKEY